MPIAADPSYRSRGLGRIETFLDAYHVADGRRPATPTERSLIKAALVDYLLTEEWLVRPAATRSATGLRALRRLRRLNLPPAGRMLIKVIERVVQDLTTRLLRREEANLIMQEHLVMLSETVRRTAITTQTSSSKPITETDHAT